MRIKIQFIVAVLLLSAASMALAVEVKKVEEKTFPLDAGGLVHLEGNEGNMVIVGWDRNEVKLRMTKRAWGRSEREAQDLLEDIEVVVRQGKDRLMIRETRTEGRRNNVFDLFDRRFWDEQGWRSQVVDFELWVPRQVKLRLQGDEGDIDLSGVKGKISIELDEGDINLASLETDDLEIRIDEGDVTLTDCRDSEAGLLKIETDEGRIRIENCRFDEMDLASDEGDLLLDEIAVRRLWITADEGDVEVDLLPIRNGSYRIEVEEGNIELVLDANPQLDVRLRASEGQIESDFDARIRDLEDGEVLETRLGGDANGQLKAMAEEGDIFIRRRR